MPTPKTPSPNPNHSALFFAAIALFIIFPFWVVLLIGVLAGGVFLVHSGRIDLRSWMEGMESQFSAETIEPLPKKSSQNFSFSPSSMPVFSASRIAKLLGVLAIVLIIIDGFVSVPAGSVAVIYDRGRGVLTQPMDEGLHLKIPFWQVSTIMDTRLQAYTMSSQEGEGSRFGTDAIEALTSDGQRITIDATVQFRVPSKNAPKIYQSIGPDYAEKVIRPGARSVIRDVSTGYESKQLFSEKTRTEAAQKMETTLRALYTNSGIELDKLLLRNITFSETYISAIEEKQVAEQKIQKAEYEKKEAEIVKDRKIIEATAEAESIRLKGEQLRANPEVVSFQFVEKMAPNISWGILPSGSLPMIDVQSLVKKIAK